MSRAIVHIGTPKTGTTSLQQWISEHQRHLVDQHDLRPYRGFFSPSHYEFPMLSLRSTRDMPMRERHADWNAPEVQSQIRAHIRSELEADDLDVLISAEGLSFVRFPDEIERLREMLAPREPTFVVCFRNRVAYLDSYRSQLARVGFPPSADTDSFRYVGDDSWVADYDAIRTVFDRPIEVDYDDAIERFGSVIPAFFDALGIASSTLPPWGNTWANRTAGGIRAKVAGRLRAAAARSRRRHDGRGTHR